MQIRNFQTFTWALAGMVAIDGLWQPVVLLGAALAPTFFATAVAPIAAGIDAAQIIFTVVTTVTFATWLYIAGKNLVDAQIDDLEFTPASRIWWFAVPFANLVKPFQGMRELRNASTGVYPHDHSDGLVGTWWALWLSNSLLTRFIGASTPDAGGSSPAWLIVTCVTGIALAVAAILIIRSVASGQARLDAPSLSEVFA